MKGGCENVNVRGLTTSGVPSPSVTFEDTCDAVSVAADGDAMIGWICMFFDAAVLLKKSEGCSEAEPGM